VTNADPPSVSVLLNQGGGSFARPRNYRVQSRPNSLALGDLNGDRKPDLAATNFLATVSVLLNRGDGTFLPKRDYRITVFPGQLEPADLNGDGRLDLATPNGDGGVTVLLNRGRGSFGGSVSFPAAKLTEGLGVGDVNADGRRDLVTADALDNTISVLINTPGLCAVQNVKGVTRSAARRALMRANCRVGRVRAAYSNTVKRGGVVSQKPAFGAVLRGGARVDLVVSLGRKR
jgi:hypothetical protein